jgi:hypothetical protein
MKRGLFASVLCSVLVAACGVKDERRVPAPEPVMSAAAPTQVIPREMTLCPASNPDKCDEIAEKLLDTDPDRARFAFGISCDARGLGGSRRQRCIEFKRELASDHDDHGAALLAGSCPSCFAWPASPAEARLHGRMTFELATPNASVKASVAKTLSDHPRPFLECYKHARLADASLAGTVRLDALVDRFGGITMITPHTRAFDNREAVTCMMHCLTKYSVSPPPTEVTVLSASLSFVPAP